VQAEEPEWHVGLNDMSVGERRMRTVVTGDHVSSRSSVASDGDEATVGMHYHQTRRLQRQTTLSL